MRSPNLEEMAHKRPALIDALPSASSDEDESSSSTDDSEDEQTPQQQPKSKQQDDSKSKSKSKPPSEDDDDEDEEESEESDEEEEVGKEKPSVQKPAAPAAPPKPKEEEEESEESGSESDSGDTEQSPTASAFTIKPILTKPMTTSSDPKKPAAKAASRSNSTPVKPTGKRPAETQQNGKDSRGKKSKVSNKDEEDGKTEEKTEEKRSAITRLWTDKDEIAVLNGLIRYKSEKGSDPNADMGAFYEFVKDSLRVDVSKNQLTDKIRRLKKKYQNNAEKGGENGEDPVLSRPHEYKTFELSKKIWGNGSAITNGGDVDNGTSNNSTARKSRKIDTLEAAKPKEEPKAIVALEEPVKDELMADQKDFSSMYPRLYEVFNIENSVYLPPLSEDRRRFLKENMSLIGSSKAKELDNKWMDLQVEELEVYSKRMELITEQSKLVLDAVKSSRNGKGN